MALKIDSKGFSTMGNPLVKSVLAFNTVIMFNHTVVSVINVTSTP